MLTIKIMYEPAAKDAPFVAYIPEFDISSCGSTQDEAIKNVKQALDITLEEAEKDDTTEELLTELGFEQPQKEGQAARPPRIVIESFSR